MAVVEGMKRLHDNRHEIPGVEVTFGRDLPLRYFKARLQFATQNAHK